MEELLDEVAKDPASFTSGIYAVSEGYGLVKYYDLTTSQFVTSSAGTARCRLVKE